MPNYYACIIWLVRRLGLPPSWHALQHSFLLSALLLLPCPQPSSPVQRIEMRPFNLEGDPWAKDALLGELRGAHLTSE